MKVGYIVFLHNDDQDAEIRTHRTGDTLFLETETNRVYEVRCSIPDNASPVMIEKYTKAAMIAINEAVYKELELRSDQ